MAGPASKDSDYTRGEMQISEQESTFELVMGIAKWGSLFLAVVILFFTMWLYPRGNFMGAAVSAFVLAAAGIFFLRKKPTAH